MHAAKVRRWGIAFVLGLCGLANLAYAGNPLFFNETTGAPQIWPNNRAVYVVETGPIGSLSNAEAVQVVDRAFQRWASLPSVNLRADNLDNILSPEVLAPFKRDITVDDFVTQVTCPVLASDPPNRQRSRFNCDEVRTCRDLGSTNCPSEVIFDNDGQIIASFFGVGSGVLGFSGPDLFIPSSNFIIAGSSVINGTFFTAEAEKGRQAIDPNDTNALFLEGVLVHEIGHFLGLGHSTVNGDTALLNPATQKLASDRPGQKATSLGPLDPLSAVSPTDVETMYPTSLFGTTGTENTPERDDESALATLYPCLKKAAESGGCSRPLSSTGTIAGRVFIPDPAKQGQFKPAQGVLVVARQIDPDNPNASLKEAVSQLAGNTFAPKRCEGVVFLDNNKNGTPEDGINGRPNNGELSFTGLFGACTQSDPPFNAGGQQECQTLLNDKFLGPGYRFIGACGFFRLGFGSPHTIGQEPQENSFALSGLTPGKYLVQALPVFQGGFSSPVRSTLGLIGLTGQLSPVVLTDDNVLPALFPNPQTGESYNGPATGCGADVTSCGDEKGDPTDDPLAYTQIEVTAGGRIENVNIIMNTSELDFLSDPGFAFCQVGDVNHDNIVNQADIQEVLRQQGSSDKGRNFNQRADINHDGQVTFFDVDLITDIVTLPRPFEVGASQQELKRGIAPFDAICRSAARDGCAIEAPVNEIDKDRVMTCARAKELGCKVMECP